jgi:hypothetical protein
VADGTQDQIPVSVFVDEDDSAPEVRQQLEQAGAQIVAEEPHEEGILPIVIIGAVLGVGALIQFVETWRINHMCQEILDCSGDKLEIRRNCGRKDGSIIAITKGDMKVEIHDVPKDIDLTDVVKAALGGDANAVQSAAEAAGAKASNPQPSGDSSTTT